MQQAGMDCATRALSTRNRDVTRDPAHDCPRSSGRLRLRYGRLRLRSFEAEMRRNEKGRILVGEVDDDPVERG